MDHLENNMLIILAYNNKYQLLQIIIEYYKICNKSTNHKYWDIQNNPIIRIKDILLKTIYNKTSNILYIFLYLFNQIIT